MNSSSLSTSSVSSAPSVSGAQRVTYNEALETLTAMFPALSPDVIKMVLELQVCNLFRTRIYIFFL